MQINKIFDKIKNNGLLPLFYHDDPEVCIAICKALYNAGISCIEFTNRGKNAVDNFEALITERNHSMPGLFLGIGTVMTASEAILFKEKNADFFVSPFFDEGVSDVSKSSGIPYVPGCMTPKDIQIAKTAGCTLIKLFPGNVLGPEFVQAIKPLFREIDFIVTGGVENDEKNISAWFNSGIVAVGMGSKLITESVIVKKDYSKLTHTCSALLEYIDLVK